MPFNQFVGSVMQAIKSVVGNFVEICDRAGDFKVSNISIQDLPLARIWPSGHHRTTLKVSDDIDDNIVNGSYFGTIVKGRK